MKVLKTFLDGKGRRLKPGMDVPSDYDKPTLSHYTRLGMIGEPPKAAQPGNKPRQAAPGQGGRPGPKETKPAPTAGLVQTSTQQSQPDGNADAVDPAAGQPGTADPDAAAATTTDSAQAGE